MNISRTNIPRTIRRWYCQSMPSSVGAWLVMLFALTLSGYLLFPTADRLHAQGAAEAQWQAQYWNNATLAGPPILTRSESTPSYDWGRGTPAGVNLGADRFSARWRTTVNLPAGRYQFSVTADDGVRLWVDSEQLINEWTVQSAQQFDAQVELDGGSVPIRLDYFENTGVAFIRLTWQRINFAPTATPTAPPTSGSAVGAPTNLWRGAYYDNIDLTQFLFERNDATLNFNWGTGSPAPGRISADRFSVRWTRTLVLDPGRYQFVVTADDGVRIWVNEQLVINEWYVQSAQTYSTVVDVTGGPVPVRVEYFENTGFASIALEWQRVTADVRTPVPIVPGTPDEQNPNVGEVSATMTGARYLNVRTGPSIRYDRITVIPNGTTVTYLGRASTGIWVQVRLPDGTIGWVNSRYFTSDTPVINLPVVT